MEHIIQTCYVLLDIKTKPEHFQEMKDFLTDAMPTALSFEGCQGVDLVENLDEAGNLLFWERWDSRDHYEKYYAFREASGVLEAFSDMLTEEPAFRFFESYDYPLNK